SHFLVVASGDFWYACSYHKEGTPCETGLAMGARESSIASPLFLPRRCCAPRGGSRKQSQKKHNPMRCHLHGPTVLSETARQLDQQQVGNVYLPPHLVNQFICCYQYAFPAILASTLLR